jgi:hypothetical protein
MGLQRDGDLTDRVALSAERPASQVEAPLVSVTSGVDGGYVLRTACAMASWYVSMN